MGPLVLLAVEVLFTHLVTQDGHDLVVHPVLPPQAAAHRFRWSGQQHRFHPDARLGILVDVRYDTTPFHL